MHVHFLVPYPFEDKVANEVKKQKNDAEVFCSRLKTMRAGLKKVGQALMQGFWLLYMLCTWIIYIWIFYICIYSLYSILF